jgi:hypothetical protein
LAPSERLEVRALAAEVELSRAICVAPGDLRVRGDIDAALPLGFVEEKSCIDGLAVRVRRRAI